MRQRKRRFIMHTTPRAISFISFALRWTSKEAPLPRSFTPFLWQAECEERSNSDSANEKKYMLNVYLREGHLIYKAVASVLLSREFFRATTSRWQESINSSLYPHRFALHRVALYRNVNDYKSHRTTSKSHDSFRWFARSRLALRMTCVAPLRTG